jgi:NADH:ubiquinone reductase (H+-translocating)
VSDRPRVLILGGGFGGVTTARALGDRARVTIVSDDNFLLFTPMLAEVAAGDVDPRHIVAPIRELCPDARLVVGTVEHVDVAARRAEVTPLLGGDPVTLEADALVLAMGSTPATFGVAGVDEAAVGFKTIGDALTIRNRLVALMERSNESPVPHATTVAVVGAGYSGAELAAALSDFLRSARRFYPASPAPRVVLIDAVDRVAPMLPGRLSGRAEKALRRRGVELRLGTAVSAVEHGAVRFEDGGSVAAATVVWAAGVRPHPLVAGLGLPTDGRGRLSVDGTMRAAPGVFALGDLAAVPDGRGDTSPPTAQFALRQGRWLGEHLPGLLEGAQPPPFRYRSKGQLVSLGHRNAVGVALGVPVSGFPGWFAWRTYYLSRLPTLLRKARVAADWTLDLLFPPDVALLPSSELGPPPGDGPS